MKMNNRTTQVAWAFSLSKITTKRYINDQFWTWKIPYYGAKNLKHQQKIFAHSALECGNLVPLSNAMERQGDSVSRKSATKSVYLSHGSNRPPSLLEKPKRNQACAL